MPKINRCDKLPEHDRLRLVGAISEGRSWRDLEADFGIAQSTIRLWAETNGYQRNPSSAKRKLVEDLLSKPEIAQPPVESAHFLAHRTESTGNPDVDAAAREDERDMRLGLQAARLALQVSALGLKAMKDSGIQDPKATKTWSECVSININTIRTIRSLNKAPDAAIVIGHNLRVVS